MDFLTPSGRARLSAKLFSKSPFVRSARPWATTLSFHPSLRPHIVEAIASSVRSQKPRAVQPCRVHRRIPRFPLTGLLDARKHSHGCEAGSKKCFEENVRSYMLQEKQASGRHLGSTRTRGGSRRIRACGVSRG